MRAMAIELLLSCGSVVDGVSMIHTAIPMVANVANMANPNDHWRMAEKVCFRTHHAIMPVPNAMPQHIYNENADGAKCCHAIPTMSGMSMRRNGMWARVYRGGVYIIIVVVVAKVAKKVVIRVSLGILL